MTGFLTGLGIGMVVAAAVCGLTLLRSPRLRRRGLFVGGRLEMPHPADRRELFG